MNLNIDQIRWMGITVLCAIAIVQFLFWLIISLSGSRERRERTEPVMPTTLPTGDQPIPAAELVGKMVILSGLQNVSEIPLPSMNFAIGRFYNPDQDVLVALDERSISRRHAVFASTPARGEYYITDAHSSYGTILRKENQPVTLTAGQQIRIYNGDIIQFGNVVTVRFVLPGEARGTSATRV